MKYSKQSNSFSCGPAALRNCLLYLGKNHSEKSLAKLAGTTKEGTNDKGIIKALQSLGYNGKIHTHKTEQAFKNKLLKVIKLNPCIVLVDHFEHYIALLEYKDRVLSIIDSDNDLKKTKIEYPLTNFLIRARNLNKEKPKLVYYELIEIII